MFGVEPTALEPAAERFLAIESLRFVEYNFSFLNPFLQFNCNDANLVTQAGSRARLKIREIRAFRTETGGRVGRSCGVVKKGEHSTDHVVRACSVVQKRAGARCCVVCGVGKERPRADGRIEAADFVVDREATNGWVVCSAREIKKCVLPLRGIAAYIASSDGGLTASDVSKTEK